MFFKEIAVDRYLPNINPEISLYEQPLLPETKQILGMLYCYYWSKEEELDEIPSEVKEEEKIHLKQESKQNFKKKHHGIKKYLNKKTFSYNEVTPSC